MKFVLLFGILLSSLAFGAGEFDAATDIVTQADTAGLSVLGTGLKWTFAVVLPLVCIGAGLIMGYTQAKKKAEQDQSTTKIYVVSTLSAIVGFFVFCIVAMFASKLLFGDFESMFTLITEFYRSAVQI